MITYKNLNGNSAVVAYEINSNLKKINVQFNSGKVYTYSSNKIGATNYNTLIEYAQRGYGLGGFIRSNPIVREGYDK